MATSAADLKERLRFHDADSRVMLHEVPWKDYERLLEIRGDSAGVRMAYLEGELELMTPSRSHETIKTKIARLLEAWAEESGIDLEGIGSWTLRKAPRRRGAEPDECYIVGDRDSRIPDIVIEVMWTPGGLDKLELYRGLSIPEVWLWREGNIEVHQLGKQGYVRKTKSRLLPGLDVKLLTSFLEQGTQTQAVRAFRRHLRRTQ
jgi:Uma2 family endonuclease